MKKAAPFSQRLLLGLDSSMSSTGALKDAAHGPEAAQKSTEGKKTRKLLTMRGAAYQNRGSSEDREQSYFHRA